MEYNNERIINSSLNKHKRTCLRIKIRENNLNKNKYRRKIKFISFNNLIKILTL